MLFTSYRPFPEQSQDLAKQNTLQGQSYCTDAVDKTSLFSLISKSINANFSSSWGYPNS